MEIIRFRVAVTCTAIDEQVGVDTTFAGSASANTGRVTACVDSSVYKHGSFSIHDKLG